MEKELMKIVIVGHVDHGKSSIIGRLFHDTDSLPEGKYDSIKEVCDKRGMPFEWSFLMDALQAERDQAITIDTSQIWFETEQRKYVIIDAPGHKEFLKNMISGAANSEAAVLVIDANEGIQEQSKRHGYLLHLLGIEQIAIAVNKMDLINYDQAIFNQIEEDFRSYLKDIGVEPTFFIPVSAREGDCVVNHSEATSWYKGPTIVEALDLFEKKKALDDLPLRFPVQDVYKFDHRRIIAGRVESGKFSVGDEIIFSPTNKKVKVKSIETWNAEAPTTATSGMSVGITLEEQIFVERGNLISHHDNAPILTNIFNARIFWMTHKPLVEGKKYKLRVNTSELIATVQKIKNVVNTDDLSTGATKEVRRYDVAEVVLVVRGLLAVDNFTENSQTGRFVLIEDYDIVGGGIIDTADYPNLRRDDELHQEEEGDVTHYKVALNNGHRGGVVWLTGLSGSGKSTIANELRKKLFAKGYQTYILEADNIAMGLNSDLGFSANDSDENIRRVAEIAKLFADSGVIVIVSLISPLHEQRMKARTITHEFFHEVYIKADIKTCEKRDPHGLYNKVRTGEVERLAGVSYEYEEPVNADIVVNTEKLNIEESVELLLEYVDENFVKPLYEIKPDYVI